MLPCRNNKDPGILVVVRDDDGANYTAEHLRLSVCLKSLVLDYETLECVTEEADVVSLEDDGHARWSSWGSWGSWSSCVCSEGAY